MATLQSLVKQKSLLPEPGEYLMNVSEEYQINGRSRRDVLSFEGPVLIRKVVAEEHQTDCDSLGEVVNR